MHITISNYEDVPRIQQQRKLTKILTLIEPFCHVPYHDGFPPDLLAQTYIHRIGVSDHEQPIGPLLAQPAHDRADTVLLVPADEEDDILVHCWAGKSRSTAAALVILYDKLRDYQKARETLLRIRPQAAPNRLICRLADMHFNFVRGGEAPAKDWVYHLYDIADELGRAQCDERRSTGHEARTQHGRKKIWSSARHGCSAYLTSDLAGALGNTQAGRSVRSPERRRAPFRRRYSRGAR